MTADRWWVRWGARWLARIDGVAKHLRLGLLAMTGISTTLLGLKSYGYGQFAIPVIVGTVVAILVYAYLYAEGGVWGQVSRDRMDMSQNFSDPPMYINDHLIAVGVFAAVQGRPPDEDEVEMLREAVEQPWEEYRDGIDLESVRDGTGRREASES